MHAYDRSSFFEPFNIISTWVATAGAPIPFFTRLDESKAFNRDRVAPTENGLRGKVHDPTARELGGVAGNAGLFSTVRDLAKFANAMIDATIASPSTMAEFVTPQANGRALGWDMPEGRSSAGDYFSASSYGHTGYTGTSIWIDPERDLFVVLLTNRVYPTAANQKHIALRRAVHDQVELAVEDVVIAVR